MSFKKKLVSLFAALAMAAGLVLAVQAPAQATVQWNCPSGVGCVWTDASGHGLKFTIAYSTYHGVCHALPFPDFEWAVSSMSADYGSGLALYLFASENCTSFFDYTYLGRHSYDNYFYQQFNDAFGSFQILPAGSK